MLMRPSIRHVSGTLYVLPRGPAPPFPVIKETSYLAQNRMYGFSS